MRLSKAGHLLQNFSGSDCSHNLEITFEFAAKYKNHKTCNQSDVGKWKGSYNFHSGNVTSACFLLISVYGLHSCSAFIQGALQFLCQ